MAETETASTDQLAEVASIKAAFPNRCRVISNDGMFSQSITVQPENMDATIKFQLPAAYPSVIPEITIRSESLTEENIIDVRQLLRSRARQMIGQHMINSLITEASTHLKGLGLKPGKISQTNKSANVQKQNKKMKKQKKKQNVDDESQDKKLPSMKTADDVVKRIIWDETLDKDDFIVGYFDRFRGLIERCFSDFSWEDLATVDYDVLAVPKHRIHYFKYKNIKVWDKTRRIDNVFGSAEGTKTIDVVMKEMQELERLGLRADEDILHNSTKNGKQSNSEDETTDEEDDDSDNDSDEIEVIINNIKPVATNKPVKESDHSKSRSSPSLCDKNEQELQRQHERYNQNKDRPNHFLCVRVTNQEILDKIGNLQDAMIEKEPLFGECCIPGSSLHLTLCTLGLDTPEQVLHCVQALKNMKPIIESALPKVDLKLNGVSHFHNNVIYAQIEHKKDVSEFVNLLKQLIQKAGVQIRDAFDFAPHVTIMKLTRPVARALGSRFVSPTLYSGHINTYFGEQKFDNINLCCISKERREDGFYETPLELHFKV